MTPARDSLAVPKVTVVIPTRNRGPLLDEALSSLRSQTFVDLELLVCDNASPDETPEVVRRHASEDERVRYQRNSADIGALKNFELGLLLARGEYLLWAADDDRWEPGFLEPLVDVLDGAPSVALACAEAQYMLSDGSPCEFIPEGLAFRPGGAAPWTPRERLHALVTSNYGNLVYGLFRRDVLMKRNPAGAVVGTAFSTYGGDSPLNEIPLLLEVAAHGAIIVLPQRLWWKRTSAETYAFAAAEAQRLGAQDNSRWLSGFERLDCLPSATAVVRALRRSVRSVPPTFRYHAKTLRDIERTLDSLPIERNLRRELVWSFRRRIYLHLLEHEWRVFVRAVSPPH